MNSVGIIGAGLVGRAWGLVFARKGWAVRLFDPLPGGTDAALAAIEDAAGDLAAAGLLDGAAADEIMQRFTACATLEGAVEGVRWVQESAPEKLEVKRDLWRRLDGAAAPDAVLASSTSALLPSTFTEGLEGAGRCLVAHPLNPPSVIPAVELVPAPATTHETMATARGVMEAIGMAVIELTREIEGFVMNRLQAALMEEAIKLVGAGVCDPEAVDVGVREGLGLRWSFIGPFEVGDLNAPGGVRDYAERYHGLFDTFVATPLPRVEWTGAVMDDIERARREIVPEAGLGERRRWRDRRLMGLAAHKQSMREQFGD